MAKTEFDEWLQNELEKQKGVYHPVKAGILERMCIRKCACAKLHPNPADEFCDPDCGPNYGIITGYAEQFLRNIRFSLPIMEEPLIVQKVSPEGYMLLNGHHRWAAANRIGLTKVPVMIVNTALDADIKAMLETSQHDRRVTLDLDEVVFRADTAGGIEKPRGLLRFGIHKRGLRQGIPALFSWLARNGYDIWVYSSEYYSVDDVHSYFERYGVRVDGVITGQNTEKKRKIISEETERLIADKYATTVHIDNDMMVTTHGQGGGFEETELDCDPADWSRTIIDALENERSK